MTGAANGLGREVAHLLAREGARVVLGDLEPSGLERTVAAIVAAGGTALAVAGDLTEEEPARRLIDAAVDRFGRVDILVNNVGGSRNAKIWEMRVEDWDFVLRLNLRPTFLCTRAAGLERVLDYMAGHPDVWFARRLDIARHWIATHPAAGRS